MQRLTNPDGVTVKVDDATGRTLLSQGGWRKAGTKRPSKDESGK